MDRRDAYPTLKGFFVSRFADAMVGGNAGLVYELGDLHAYWPAGVEADAVDVWVIWTDLRRDEQAGMHGGKEEIAQAEAQVLVSEVASPKIRHDKVVHGGATWVVAALLETVGGMHRLTMEQVKATVKGSGRGR